MKTPAEIKKGLECCSQNDLQDCAGCPYGPTNCAFKNADALAYIKQLECKAQPITCGECEYYGKSPMGSTQQGWCRLDCKHRSPGFWCANADSREISNTIKAAAEQFMHINEMRMDGHEIRFSGFSPLPEAKDVAE